MYRRNDPRFRRTLNEISHTLESANETAQARVFVFGQEYISPCLSSVYSCFSPCVEHCFPQRERGRRAPGRGRAELNFDFYDDWEEDETDGLLGWDDEEYDGFMSGPGSYGATQPPTRQRAMSYGTRKDGKGRKAGEAGVDSAGQGPSYLGFFKGLTGKLGKGKGLRYKPSAAGLQEHPGGKKPSGEESEPLMTDESDGDAVGRRRHGRKRSETAGSEQTTDSFSSRGDIFPSEDEDDAVPLDDEFAMVLERRTTGSGQDDGSSGVGGKRPSLGSRRSTRTRSSRSTPRSKRSSRAASHGSPTRPDILEPDTVIVPTLNELKQEEERARIEEERAVEERRQAARKLAADRGMAVTNSPVSPSTPNVRTPTRQSSHHEGNSPQVNDSVATIRHPSTPIPHMTGVEITQDEDFGEYEESPSVAAADAAPPPESSFSPARLPRFS